jgi:HEAT repeat protein
MRTNLPIVVALLMLAGFGTPAAGSEEGEFEARARDAKDDFATPADPDETGRSENDARFRDAMQALERSPKTRELRGALKVLCDGYPESRPVLAESLRIGSPRARAFALKILGQKGGTDKDLALVTKALADSCPRVRLAAVMAMQRFGGDGFQELVHHIPSETEPNNRKMAIIVLQRWGDKRAVPYLVRWLERERDQNVRDYCVRALEALSGERLGKNAAAWSSYLEATRLRATKALLIERRPLKPGV